MFPTFFSFCPLLEDLLGVNGDNGTDELWGSAAQRDLFACRKNAAAAFTVNGVNAVDTWHKFDVLALCF